MSKYISEELTEEKISQLTNEYVYLIGGECGSGKTTAIMKNLYEYAKKENQQILYLCNRSSLEEQLQQEHIERVKDRITIGMYQSITTFVEKNFCLPFHKMAFDYVVIDEAHLIFDSSDYDINPILFVEYLNNISSIVIALTGTPRGFLKLERYLNRDIKALREVDKTNNPVRNIYMTEDNNEFINLKKECLKNGYKNLELTDSVSKFESFKEQNKYLKVANIASKHRLDFKMIMNDYDMEVREGIIKSQKMMCDALITTTAMEVGINIKARENYLVSFNSLQTPSTIVQFASRIRVSEKDKFHINLIFLIKKPSKKKINKMKERLRKINRLYKYYGDYTGISENYDWALGEKDRLLGIVDSREVNPITKECLEEKIAFQEKFYESENLMSDYGEMLKELYPNINIICLEKQKIENYLNELMQEKESVLLIENEERMKFRAMLKELGVTTKKKSDIPGVTLINQYLIKYKIKYFVKQDKKRLNGKKNQTRYWEVVKHVA